MRTASTAILLLIGTAFLFVGCSGTAAPTAPSASASIAPLSASAALPAAAPKEVPFKGELAGTDADSNPTSTTIDVTTDGSGTATLLGNFTFRQRVTLCFAGACAN